MDAASPNRAMEQLIDRANNRTIENCIAICKDNQKKYAGLQVVIKYAAYGISI